MNGMKAGKSEEGESLFENLIPDIKLARALGLRAMIILALPGEVLLRRQFGERYFRGYYILFAFLFLLLLNWTGSFAAFIPRNFGRTMGAAETADPETDATPLMGFFILLFLLVCMAHRLDAFRRRFQNARLHSYSSGQSWLASGLPSLSEQVVQFWIEPAVLVLVGLLVRRFDNALGWVLMISGAAIFCKEIWRSNVLRDRFLDMVDAQIEAENLVPAVVEQRPSSQTEGFKVAGAIPFRSRAERERLVAGIKGELAAALPPALPVTASATQLPGANFRPASFPDQTRG